MYEKGWNQIIQVEALQVIEELPRIKSFPPVPIVVTRYVSTNEIRRYETEESKIVTQSRRVILNEKKSLDYTLSRLKPFH